jgi:hypothetical protein
MEVLLAIRKEMIGVFPLSCPQFVRVGVDATEEAIELTPALDI